MARKKEDSELPGTTLALSERARGLLKLLVEHHIRDGQPVGSKVLARNSGLELSAATVRNVMADLEELGLVFAPHTSAGRIPTVRGYRLFIDTLLTAQPLARVEMERIREGLTGSDTVDELMSACSNLLSSVSRMAGVVMVPRRDFAALRRIEFVPLSEQRVLAILVVSEREIQNRVIHLPRPLSDAQLQEAANRLNALLMAKDLDAVRNALMREMREVQETVNLLMHRAVEAADQLFEHRAEDQNVVFAGQTNLMRFSELSNLDMLRTLFEAFTEKRELLHLLDACRVAQSVQVYVGEESGYQALEHCSLVAAPYGEGGKVLGVLGVVGPTRMDYERVIPLVDVTAKMLSSILNFRD